MLLTPIAIARTPYKEKFSVPRQPGLIEDGEGMIEFLAPYHQPEIVRGLEDFSHLWLLFQFDRIESGKWHPTVRPPRLGGNQRIGVFATRATHRPNPIGLSKVRLLDIISRGEYLALRVGSIDLVDNTPIFDIKPYIAYVDSEPEAKCGFAQNPPRSDIQVIFSENAQQVIRQRQNDYPHLARFIQQLIAQDPRPAYQREQLGREYGMQIWEFNVRFVFVEMNLAKVLVIA